MLKRTYHSLWQRTRWSLASRAKKRESFYAVAKGRKTGVFKSWDECKKQVEGVPNVFKKFSSEADAKAFLASSVQSSHELPSGDAESVASVMSPRTPSKPKELSMRASSPKKNPPVVESELLRFGEHNPKPALGQYTILPSWTVVPATDKQNICVDQTFSTIADAESFLKNQGCTLSPILQSWVLPSKGPPTAVVRPPAPTAETGDATTTTGYRINELPPHRPITLEEVAKLRIIAPHFFAEPIDVYCDGSCLNNGTSNAVAGYGVFYSEFPCPLSGDNVFEKIPQEENQTNNRGELLAVIRVVEDFIKGRGSSGRLFPQLRRLDIKSDSTYMRKGYYEWMSGWIKNGWKLSGGGPVKNQDLFKRLEQVMKEAQIYFERVMLMHLEKAEEEEKREAARPASSKGLQSEGSKQDMIDVDAVDSDDELPTQRKRMETNGAPTSSAQYPIDNNGINAALNRRGDAGNPTPVKPLSSSSLHVPRFAEITYVAGHSNHPGNDAADELARKGAGLHYRT